VVQDIARDAPEKDALEAGAAAGEPSAATRIVAPRALTAATRGPCRTPCSVPWPAWDASSHSLYSDPARSYFVATAFTAMCFGFASSPLGSFTVSTPFSNEASVFAASISTGNVNER
jgi:hypothetical protein